MKWMGIGFWLVLALPSLLMAEEAKAADASQVEKGVALLETRVAMGDAQATFELAQAYRLGRGVRTDIDKARVYYRMAAAKGHLDAGAALALIVYYLDGNKAKGVRLWRDVAVCGHGASALMLAALYANGENVPENIALARAYAGIARSESEVGADDLLMKLGGMTPDVDEQAGKLRATCGAKSKKDKPSVVMKTNGETADAPNAAIGTESASGAWRVQVGAFSSRMAAARAWARLMTLFPDQTDGLSPHFEESTRRVADKPLIRLQLLGYKNAENANEVCRIFIEKQHACLVVSP